MVVLKFIVCVLGAVCLDNVLDTVHLSFGLTRFGVEHVARHSLKCRELLDKASYLTLGVASVRDVVVGVESLAAEFFLEAGIRDLVHYKGFKTSLLNKTGNKTYRCLVTEGVLNADTVFNVLQSYLRFLCSLDITVHCCRSAVFQVRQAYLREKLLLNLCGCFAFGTVYIIRIREEYLSGRGVLQRDLTGIILIPKLVSVFLIYHDHIRKLLFRIKILLGKVVYNRFVILVYLCCVYFVEGHLGIVDLRSAAGCSGSRSLRCRNRSGHRAGDHHRCKEACCYFLYHCVSPPSLLYTVIDFFRNAVDEAYDLGHKA